ncbi:unnamed protein product [Paramecium pentaurelia]|uniref:Uncharacterized protein n=1 Tax=Paramecium pentaurelia TaxID=43138 RepID=A0A8S1XEK9_9CILI|nr:unnamed protein product [Paramecium pentaurelia]
MQFDNLFGYEEQQEQKVQPLIQKQQVQDIKELFKQQKPSQILNYKSKRRGKKQQDKLNRFKQQMSLNPKSKGKIQKKNSITGQVPIENSKINLPLILLKIQEYSQALKDQISKIDIVITQYQSQCQNKQLQLVEDQYIQNLQKCLLNCLIQFQQLQQYFPNLFIQRQYDQSDQIIKLGQDDMRQDYTFLDHRVSLPEIKFSQISKNEHIKLDKMRITASSKLYGGVICEQRLYKNDISKFAFKINKIDGNIGIGVCNKDIFIQQNYQYDQSQITKGLYLFHNYGSIYRNQENGLLQGQTFEFQQSDIIIVIVNFQKQYIKWKKYKEKSQFSIYFDVNNELYPCVVFSKLSSFKKVSQVTIVKPKTLQIIDGSSIFGDN